MATILNLALFERYVIDSLLLFNVLFGIFPFMCHEAVLLLGSVLMISDLLVPLFVVSFTMFYLSFIIVSTLDFDEDEIGGGRGVARGERAPPPRG